MSIPYVWVKGNGRQTRRKPTFIDLFAGAGGFSLGFIDAGWHGVAALEYDVSAATTYWYNLCGEHSTWIGSEETIAKRDKALVTQPFNPNGWADVDFMICDDIRNWHGLNLLNMLRMEIGEVDAIIGGPPCQGFSRAGRRNVHDPRNSMIWQYARLVHEIKPKTYVLENVPEITTMTTPSGHNLFNLALKAFEDEGYLSVAQRLDEALENVDAAASGVRAADQASMELAGEPVQLDLFGDRGAFAFET